MESVKQRLIRAFWFTLAVLFLIESWLWDHVKLWILRLAAALGVKELEARLRAFIAGLSPIATLAVFALPAITIFPLKLLAVAAIAHGHVVTGLAVILAAKTLALGVTSFLFDASREKLLQIGWFAKLYAAVLRVSRWAHERVEPFKQKIRKAKDYLKARLSRALGEEGRSLFLRKLALLRALVRRRGAA
ncbi:hypothetical protein FM996_13970 [Methylosinus sporium]|uniref:Uncharacterized protein n=1 Tax=Methylosinus sporium TaxID=428 RepID=A0A549SNQ2_METSR|nr:MULTISPECIES: hypothetical protein [Methylosinus]MBU3888303.1 hypothetical protein [Methylosinus sp. KRF6]TRL31262.1 hypothetical protein FM996_13970 [Methylosinus sporium]